MSPRCPRLSVGPPRQQQQTGTCGNTFSRFFFLQSAHAVETDRSYKCSKCITNTSLKHCLDFHWFPCHVLSPADFISPKAGASTLSTVSTEPVHWPGALKATSAPCKGLEGSGRHWAGTACLLYKTNLQHIEKFVIFLHHYVPVLSIVKIICSRGANLKDTVLQQVYSAKCLISHR